MPKLLTTTGLEPLELRQPTLVQVILEVELNLPLGVQHLKEIFPALNR